MHKLTDEQCWALLDEDAQIHKSQEFHRLRLTKHRFGIIVKTSTTDCANYCEGISLTKHDEYTMIQAKQLTHEQVIQVIAMLQRWKLS